MATHRISADRYVSLKNRTHEYNKNGLHADNQSSSIATKSSTPVIINTLPG